MDWKRKVLAVFGGIFLMWVLTALLLPSQYMVSKSLDINGYPKVVYHLVNDLGHHTKWDEQAISDSSYQLNCLGATVGGNASCDYRSEAFGDGIIRILSDNGVNSVSYTHEKGDNKVLHTYSAKILSGDNNTSNVTLMAMGKSGFFGRVFNWYAKRKVGKEITKSLYNLQKVAEERSLEGIYNRYQVNTRAENQRFFITRQGTVEMSDVPAFYARTVPILYDLTVTSKNMIAGDPVIIYEKSPLDSLVAIVKVGLPSLAVMNIKDTESIMFPPASVVTTMCSISDLDAAHESIREYMIDRALVAKSPVIETYITKPTNEGIDTPQKVMITYYFIEN